MIIIVMQANSGGDNPQCIAAIALRALSSSCCLPAQLQVTVLPVPAAHAGVPGSRARLLQGQPSQAVRLS